MTALLGSLRGSGCRALGLLLSLASAVAYGETAAPAAPLPVVREIRYVGLKVTQPKILQQELFIQVGDPADPAKIAESRQAIVDLELFSSVVATTVPHEGGVAVVFTVKEKYYLLPIPRLRRDADGQITVGGQLRLDNLYGLNQRVRLTYEEEGVPGSDTDNTRSTRLEYRMPRIGGSIYGIEINAAHVETPSQVLSGAVVLTDYVQFDDTATFLMTRWLTREGANSGWYGGLGLGWSRTTAELTAGDPALMPEGRSITWLARVGHRHLHDHLFSKSGFDYGYNFESSIPAWSTNDHTMTHVFYYRHYLRNLTGPEHENLNFQAELGLSHGMPVNGESPFRIGGSTSIRGYELNSIEGNAYVQFNMEYLRPIGEHRDWRWLMFVDAGNAFPSGNDITLNGLYWSTGVGMRWRLRRFVKINLRLDYAYAFETGERKFYAGTHETF